MEVGETIYFYTDVDEKEIKTCTITSMDECFIYCEGYYNITKVPKCLVIKEDGKRIFEMYLINKKFDTLNLRVLSLERYVNLLKENSHIHKFMHHEYNMREKPNL